MNELEFTRRINDSKVDRKKISMMRSPVTWFILDSRHNNQRQIDTRISFTVRYSHLWGREKVELSMDIE